MRWKPDVILEKKDGYLFVYESKKKQVKKEDEYIIQLVEQGIYDDKRLVANIMKNEEVDELLARFRLAQFIVDYGDYIEELNGYQKIEV